MAYVLLSAKLNATRLGWVGELADFGFNIKYRTGKCHIDADNFSRMPFDISKCMPEFTESIPVKTMYQSAEAISVGKGRTIDYGCCQLSKCIERGTVKEQCRECIYKERN